MFKRARKIHNKHSRKSQSLIASNRIKPEQWQISNAEAKDALKAQGCKVKEIKKIRCLKHQVCISYWDEKGGVCSGFFSYRIFTQWQLEVERLIDICQTLKEGVLLNHIMKYEFACYPYLKDMKDILSNALKNRLYILETSVLQAG
ncbi:hypothetical protein F7734_48320 [Scytonema sp. UIC 10036]|uniref:hypothetical protein n=1 Tax=Scytonema sp. UIC 10036 TaxID=2304196 RepID=UPI0012DA373F|nr:hypothetical protein [Scytonema sp. UIC 10036]MUG99676.1 hypothetical protein [Scytonema sp. UIC 10036]